MTNKLVTIILPVYNGEKYLKRAIDSVLNQTIGYDKLTLLVINDGGTDSSSQIISNYQKKYPELIHFIDRENKGVAIKNLYKNSIRKQRLRKSMLWWEAIGDQMKLEV